MRFRPCSSLGRSLCPGPIQLPEPLCQVCGLRLWVVLLLLAELCSGCDAVLLPSARPLVVSPRLLTSPCLSCTQQRSFQLNGSCARQRGGVVAGMVCACAHTSGGCAAQVHQVAAIQRRRQHGREELIAAKPVNAMAWQRPCCSTPLTQQLASRQGWQRCHCKGAVPTISRRPDRTNKQADGHAVDGVAASKAARSDQKQAPQAAPADAREIQAAACFLRGAPCAEMVDSQASERACVLWWAQLVYAAHAAGRQAAKRLDRGWGDVL